MSGDQVNLFPDPTMIWSLVNLIVLLVIPAAIVLAIVYVIRLNRRVKRMEDRLNQKDE